MSLCLSALVSEDRVSSGPTCPKLEASASPRQMLALNFTSLTPFLSLLPLSDYFPLSPLSLFLPLRPYLLYGGLSKTTVRLAIQLAG